METLRTNRIAQTSRENPVESLWTIDVNWSYYGVNGRRILPLFNNGISLVSIYQGRGNRHTYSVVSLGHVSVDARRPIHAPMEDAIESHCGSTILRFWRVWLLAAVVWVLPEDGRAERSRRHWTIPNQEGVSHPPFGRIRSNPSATAECSSLRFLSPRSATRDRLWR